MDRSPPTPTVNAGAIAGRASWQRDRHGRRRAIALGYVRNLLRDHPDDLAEVVTAAVHAVDAAERELAS